SVVALFVRALHAVAAGGAGTEWRAGGRARGALVARFARLANAVSTAWRHLAPAAGVAAVTVRLVAVVAGLFALHAGVATDVGRPRAVETVAHPVRAARRAVVGLVAFGLHVLSDGLGGGRVGEVDLAVFIAAGEAEQTKDD